MVQSDRPINNMHMEMEKLQKHRRVVNWLHDIQVASRTRAARVLKLVLEGAILFQGGRFIVRPPADLYRYRFAPGDSVSI